MRELLLMILYMKLVIVKYLNFSYINTVPSFSYSKTFPTYKITHFHGRLVRRWCESFEVIHFRKWVHHGKNNNQPCNCALFAQLQG